MPPPVPVPAPETLQIVSGFDPPPPAPAQPRGPPPSSDLSLPAPAPAPNTHRLSCDLAARLRLRSNSPGPGSPSDHHCPRCNIAALPPRLQSVSFGSPASRVIAIGVFFFYRGACIRADLIRLGWGSDMRFLKTFGPKSSSKPENFFCRARVRIGSGPTRPTSNPNSEIKSLPTG